MEKNGGKINFTKWKKSNSGMIPIGYVTNS